MRADFENAEAELVFDAKVDFSGDLLLRSRVSGQEKNGINFCISCFILY